MSLYQKHRPKTLQGIYGNKALVNSLSNILYEKNKPHVFLLHGPTGCGKTTIGRIIANELGCTGSDFNEIDSADFRGIDTIRSIRSNMHFKPLESDCRVWLFDECHKLSNDAQNALLKALEDTPNHVYFVLCTTDPQKLIQTIRGRCSQYQVTPLDEKNMFRLLKIVAKKEGKILNKNIIDAIVDSSNGYPRNALQTLNQVLSTDNENEQLIIAQQSNELKIESIELCRALIKKEPWKKITIILKDLRGEDAEKIRRQVLGYCESVLLNGQNDQAAKIIESFFDPLYDIGFSGLVFACYCVIFGE